MQYNFCVSYIAIHNAQHLLNSTRALLIVHGLLKSSSFSGLCQSSHFQCCPLTENSSMQESTRLGVSCTWRQKYSQLPKHNVTLKDNGQSPKKEGNFSTLQIVLQILASAIQF